MHQRLLEEPDFGLGRVDVDVDPVGRDLDEQVDLGATLLDRRDGIGLGDRVRDRPVLDDAAIDEDVLGAADRSLVAEDGDVSMDLQAGRFLPDLDQIGAFAEQLEEALAQPRRRRALEQLPAAARRRGRPCSERDANAALVSEKPTVG